MASVRKIQRKAKDGRAVHSWQVRYYSPDFKQRARNFPTKVLADKFAREVEVDKDRGSYTDPGRGRITLAQWAEEWLPSKVDLRQSSRDRLESIVRIHVLPAFGSRPLNSISNSDVRAWVAEMNTRMAAGTVRKNFNALRQLMSAAVDDQRISSDPTLRVPLPSEHSGEQRFLDQEEIDRLADSIHPRFRAFILLATYGGLRMGELAGLRRKRIDVLKSTVTVAEQLVESNGQRFFGPPKTNKSKRTVPLPRSIMTEIENHLSTYVEPDGEALVFTGERGGLLRRKGFSDSYWQPAIEEAGLDGLRVHDLRHTFVALWIAMGADPKTISVRAGHSSVAFTLDRYGHLYEANEHDIAERLDIMLQSTKPAKVEDATVTSIH